MKRLFACLLVLPILLVSGCGGNSSSNPAQSDSTHGITVSVYYPVAQLYDTNSAVSSEVRTLPEDKEPVEALMNLLLEGPLSPDLTSPIPPGVSLEEWSLAQGVLHLKLSEAYGGLSGIDLTIADYCMTLTMCQLDEVRSVIISAKGGVFPTRYYQVLRNSDVLLSSSEDDLISLAVDLYFPLADGSGLSWEKREVLMGGNISRSAAVVAALLEGPESEQMTSLMPGNVTLRSVSMEKGICYVDFSQELAQAPIAQTDEGALLLYSLVNTLGDLSGVEGVQLLIEGRPPASFGGIPTSNPLEPDLSLLAP